MNGYTINTSENVKNAFLEDLYKMAKLCYESAKEWKCKMKPLTQEQKSSYAVATNCHICNKVINSSTDQNRMPVVNDTNPSELTVTAIHVTCAPKDIVIDSEINEFNLFNPISAAHIFVT